MLTYLDGMMVIRTENELAEFLPKVPNVVYKSVHMKYTLFERTPII